MAVRCSEVHLCSVRSRANTVDARLRFVLAVRFPTERYTGCVTVNALPDHVDGSWGLADTIRVKRTAVIKELLAGLDIDVYRIEIAGVKEITRCNCAKPIGVIRRTIHPDIIV